MRSTRTELRPRGPLNLSKDWMGKTEEVLWLLERAIALVVLIDPSRLSYSWSSLSHETRSNWTDPRLDDLNGRVTLAHDRIDSMWRTCSWSAACSPASSPSLAAMIGLIAKRLLGRPDRLASLWPWPTQS